MWPLLVPKQNSGIVYDESWTNHELRMAIMSGDSKVGMRRVGWWREKCKWAKYVTPWNYKLIENKNKNKIKEGN